MRLAREHPRAPWPRRGGAGDAAHAAVALRRAGRHPRPRHDAGCDRAACGGSLVLSRRGALRTGARGGARAAAGVRLRRIPHPVTLPGEVRGARRAAQHMHGELVIPGLFAAPAAARLPAAELIFARGRCTSGPSQALEAWLNDAFGLEDQPVAAGALTMLAAGGEPGNDVWTRADPVHLRLMRDRLVLVPPAALRIARDEAEALAGALNAHFGNRLALQVVDEQRWVARLPAAMEVAAQAPLPLAGCDVAGALPPNAASPAHRILNEAQMVLHAHPVNEARETRGEPPVNSIWLWGAGRTPKVESGNWHSVSADDPVPLGLARAAGIRHRLLGPSAAEWLERMPEEGRHL